MSNSLKLEGLSPSTKSDVLGTMVDTISRQDFLSRLEEWVRSPKGRYVCFPNVHVVIEGRDSPEFQRVVNQADIAVPDGMPVVWYLRKNGHPDQDRLPGPSMMLEILSRADRNGWKIGLLGGSEETLGLLTSRIQRDYPNLSLVFTNSPPFREITEQEDGEVCQQIEDLGVQILFVGLGCPKQERWMAAHRGKLTCVMFGVGAAFRFHSGELQRAPKWVQSLGLEWFHRICREPRKLFGRYARTNPRFAVLAVSQTLRGKASAKSLAHEDLAEIASK